MEIFGLATAKSYVKVKNDAVNNANNNANNNVEKKNAHFQRLR